ncbi:MAG: MotA/TolQ/ExbB proton channel family protein [Planctomycetota bacterium]
MANLVFLADASWAWQLVTSGGIAGMALLGVLLLLSLAALSLTIEQLATLRLARLAPDGLAARVRKLLQAGDLAGAKQACGDGGMLGVIAASAIDEAQDLAAATEPAWPAIEKAMEDAAEVESARLNRRVDYLALIGSLAPMIGLLGTVVGMIFAFREVAATQGAATAGELASGIYQALVTTVGGLIVAIPSVAAYFLFRGRIEALSAEVARQAADATRPLKQALSSGSTPRVQPPSPSGRVV